MKENYPTPEIPITSEMERAGLDVFLSYDPNFDRKPSSNPVLPALI